MNVVRRVDLKDILLMFFYSPLIFYLIEYSKRFDIFTLVCRAGYFLVRY